MSLVKDFVMNKSELIDAVAEQSGLTKADTTKALNGLIDTLTDAMKRGDDVVLVGFGTFSVKERAARTGRNPKTGEPLKIAASKVPSFKAGKGLKDAVNG
ncbi:MAG: HU family DNA-binding protein [Moraxella sp.]|nr:HU family DNA-binding protein [Moraxella sp.]